MLDDRRKDCLRQFLVVLYERRELELLVSLTYRDRDVVLEAEVCNPVLSSSRQTFTFRTVLLSSRLLYVVLEAEVYHP